MGENKINKLLFVAISFCVETFLLWYVLGSFANVYSCDDYGHATNVQNMGFLQTQLYMYLNWEGSFVHTFLATLPHLFKSEITPFLANISAVFFLFFAIFKITTKFCHNVYWNKILIPLYFVSCTLLYTVCGAEIRYWVCANITYLFGISTAILSAHYYYYSNTKKDKILFCVFLFLTCGNKISFIPFIYILCVNIDLIANRFTLKKFLFLSLLFVLFSAPNILAPGNYVRLAINSSVSSDLDFSYLDVLIIQIKDVVIPAIINSIFFIPAIMFFNNRTDINRTRIIICAIELILCFLVINAATIFICFKNQGPIRNNIILEVSTFIGMIAIYYSIINKLRFEKYVYSYVFICLCAIIVCVNNYKFFKYIPTTYNYSRLHKERDSIVFETEKDTIMVNKLPPSGLLHNEFCNNKEWLNNVYLPYWEKDNCVILIND